ncbi:MAG TPA: hypothetical protein VGU63_08630 [Candidatus Acidoferrales bacterium]|nr:hypothetical protein [Candidatus Acidoferrales bacterium]
MSLIVIVIMVQAVSSTLAWLGFYVGIRALPGARARQSRWITGSAVVAAAWLVGVFLLGAAGNDVLPLLIPMALVATLLLGYLLLLSPTFSRIVAAVPQHWLIGIQAFRILGAVWLVRYFTGGLPGLFALPAGIGDVATGLLAPFVAYAWYSGKPYARSAAIAWNLFGMADLINAVVLGTLTNGGPGGIVFPLLLIPAYGVPHSLLIHSYSLIGLLRKTSQQPRRAKSIHYEMNSARA